MYSGPDGRGGTDTCQGFGYKKTKALAKVTPEKVKGERWPINAEKRVNVLEAELKRVQNAPKRRAETVEESGRLSTDVVIQLARLLRRITELQRTQKRRLID